MANRRMIARDVVRSDGFITLPFTAQALYLQLTIETDDAGFVGAPKSVLRLSGCSEGDLTALEESGFIYRFESGAVLLRHWRIANTVQADRRKATTFQSEFDRVKQDSNKVYVMMDANCIQNESSMEGQENVTQRNTTEHNPAEANLGEPRQAENSYHAARARAALTARAAPQATKSKAQRFLDIARELEAQERKEGNGEENRPHTRLTDRCGI